jgi:hypothetical protein
MVRKFSTISIQIIISSAINISYHPPETNQSIYSPKGHAETRSFANFHEENSNN